MNVTKASYRGRGPSKSYRRPAGTVYSRMQGRKANACCDKELKYKDVSHASAATGTMSTAVFNTVIATLARGDTAQTRIGSKVFLRSLFIKGVLELDAGTNDEPIRFRIMVIVDHQSNGAVPTVAEVFDLGATDDISSFRMLQNTKRFSVLYDKTNLINHVAGAGNGTTDNYNEVDRLWSFYKKFKNPLKIQFKSPDAAGGADADILDNNVFVAIAVNTARGTDRWESRIRFTD